MINSQLAEGKFSSILGIDLWRKIYKADLARHAKQVRNIIIIKGKYLDIYPS